MWARQNAFYQLATSLASSLLMSLEGEKNEMEDIFRTFTLFGGQHGTKVWSLKTRIRKFVPGLCTRPITFQREQPEWTNVIRLSFLVVRSMQSISLVLNV
jgi:hypothetical protein